MRLKVIEVIPGAGEYAAEAVVLVNERLRGAKTATPRAVKLRLSDKAEGVVTAAGDYDCAFDFGVISQTLPTKDGGTWQKDSACVTGISDARKAA